MDKENVKPSLVRVPLKAIADKGKGKRVFVDEENFMYLKNKDKPNGVTYLHCRNKKDGERKEARNDQFNRNRDYDPELESNNSFSAVSLLCFVARKPTDWYADSGATHHMTDQRSYFSTFKAIGSETWKVNRIGGAQLNALGFGNIPVHSYARGGRISSRVGSNPFFSDRDHDPKILMLKKDLIDHDHFLPGSRSRS